MYKIIIADDHPLLLKGTKDFLSGHYQIIGEYSNGIEAYNAIVSKQPDIAVLDISMPGIDGLEIAQKVSTENIKTKIVLLTMHNESALLNKAKENGVVGYLLKDFALDELINCINTVAKGDTYFSLQLMSKIKKSENQKDIEQQWRGLLTSSEIKILELIAQQKTSKEIAGTFFISEKTVESHRSNIIKKLKISGEKNSLLLWCIKNL